MVYGQIKPTLIQVVRYRFRYRLWKLPKDKPLIVIAFDMKKLLVANERVTRVYSVFWEDVQLVESEKIIPITVVQNIDNTKNINRIREKKPFFKAGTKDNT